MADFDPGTTPSGGDTPGSASPVATPQAAPVAAPTTPTAPQAPATGAGEDRSNWVPPYRLRETREAAVRESQAQWAQREAEYQARLNQIQTQLHALVGVAPQQNPEIDAIRSQFGQLYPGLSRLEAQAQQLQELLERSQDLESQNDHYWASYGRQSMDKLFTHAQESLGAPLTDEGKRQLHAAFVGFVQSSPEMTARYANDPTLVQEFWRQFTSSFIDPVRRTAAAATMQRVPGALPQDTPGGAPRSAPPPSIGSIDDRANAAWTIYQQTAHKP